MLDQFEKLPRRRRHARSPGSRPMRRPSSRPRPSSKPPGAISSRPSSNLRYCDIVAEIDGVVTRRNVNPGNNVQVGQSLMAVRSLTEIWVDANFKETQLRDLRIGQPVDLDVDMYGGKHVFKGRITGFTMGTGSTLALLPAAERHGQFRQGRPAVAGADRPVGLRPRQDAAVHRHVGRALRLFQQAADRTRCREVPPEPTCRHRRRPGPAAERVGQPTMTDAGALRHLRRAVRRGDQPVGRRRRRRGADLHGGARHHDRQRRAALHRRRPVGHGRRQRMGHHQLPRRQRDHPADLRLADRRVSAAATTSCCRSPSSPSPPGCAAWPPASAS